jgi:amino acid transporter
MIENKQKFGTMPVFLTAISTILGAILFLRFGYAVGTTGFWGVLLIIVLGHCITIPTALAISEIATNKRVEGGGEYFMISRSFGLNIGSTIGLALFLSQAISIAFYVIAFTESFGFLFTFLEHYLNIEHLPRQIISVPVMLLLTFLIVKKGANMGIKALYVITSILFLALLFFFIGSPEGDATLITNPLHNFTFKNPDLFFVVFAIVFPAFTGMTAGVGLSGDLKNPGRAIPIGTTLATLFGMIVYIFVCYKLSISVTGEEMIENQLIMEKIAIGGIVIIPLGLAASTLSSAIGSAMIGPRTLQALARDRIFPITKINHLLAKGRKKDGEPVNASLFTCLLALAFVLVGEINAVAKIISMFFLLTYGSLCLISFLNHFGSSPSYRPEFRSRWWISLIGFIASVWVMFKIDTIYAVVSFVILTLVYIYINSYHKQRRGLASIFINTLSQLNRTMFLYIQKQSESSLFQDWRPSVICVSKHSLDRANVLNLLNWIANKYGFCTYLHWIEGAYSETTYETAKTARQKLIDEYIISNSVFIDTIIASEYPLAIAQAAQLPGVAGIRDNIMLFEFEKDNKTELQTILPNCHIALSGNFDLMILATSNNPVHLKGSIHIWLNALDNKNLNLMLMLSFIILNHPDWRKANIKVFVITSETEQLDFIDSFKTLVTSGRIPIMMHNIEFISQQKEISFKELVNCNSESARLIIMGMNENELQNPAFFTGYNVTGDILFVNSRSDITIE